MRYIDIERLTPSTEWIEQAKSAKQAVEQTLPNHRTQAINQRSRIWRDLKDQLAALSFGKCWYCETKIQRSDSTVDHFRPKAQVWTCVILNDSKNGPRVKSQKVEEHEGYWWLAFEWRNYRYSCQFCNMRRRDATRGGTGGKGMLFPLLDENTRAKNPTDALFQEKVALLDPTNPRDPMLLWFDQTGNVVPAPDISDEEKKRVIISVFVYHLNYSSTQQKRQVLFNRIESLVKNLNDAIRQGNVQQQTSILRELRKYIDPQAEYSVAARDFLKGLRSEDNAPVIERLLETA